MTEQEMTELNLAVGIADNLDAYIEHGHCYYDKSANADSEGAFDQILYRPTMNRGQAMLLQEKHNLTCGPDVIGATPVWRCMSYITQEQIEQGEYPITAFGETPCIAICNCVVAIKR